ncbi:hypothetical protein GCM10010230_55690 [Streptomyces narbonensis]|nr:hypothetical protein GCM10010230_55690 [Streptomyces narbonensis]
MARRVLVGLPDIDDERTLGQLGRKDVEACFTHRDISHSIPPLGIYALDRKGPTRGKSNTPWGIQRACRGARDADTERKIAG